MTATINPTKKQPTWTERTISGAINVPIIKDTLASIQGASQEVKNTTSVMNTTNTMFQNGLLGFAAGGAIGSMIGSMIGLCGIVPLAFVGGLVGMGLGAWWAKNKPQEEKTETIKPHDTTEENKGDTSISIQSTAVGGAVAGAVGGAMANGGLLDAGKNLVDKAGDTISNGLAYLNSAWNKMRNPAKTETSVSNNPETTTVVNEQPQDPKKDETQSSTVETVPTKEATDDEKKNNNIITTTQKSQQQQTQRFTGKRVVSLLALQNICSNYCTSRAFSTLPTSSLVLPKQATALIENMDILNEPTPPPTDTPQQGTGSFKNMDIQQIKELAEHMQDDDSSFNSFHTAQTNEDDSQDVVEITDNSDEHKKKHSFLNECKKSLQDSLPFFYFNTPKNKKSDANFRQSADNNFQSFYTALN